MACEITITTEDGRLRVHVTGELDLEAGERLAAAIHGASIERRTPQVLLDLREVVDKLSIVDLVSLGEFASQLEPHVFTKVALLILEKDLQPDRFFEKAAQNRGLYLQVFTDAGAALAWLASA